MEISERPKNSWSELYDESKDQVYAWLRAKKLEGYEVVDRVLVYPLEHGEISEITRLHNKTLTNSFSDLLTDDPGTSVVVGSLPINKDDKCYLVMARKRLAPEMFEHLLAQAIEKSNLSLRESQNPEIPPNS